MHWILRNLVSILIHIVYLISILTMFQFLMTRHVTFYNGGFPIFSLIICLLLFLNKFMAFFQLTGRLLNTLSLELFFFSIYLFHWILSSPVLYLICFLYAHQLSPLVLLVCHVIYIVVFLLLLVLLSITIIVNKDLFRVLVS